MYLQLFDVFMQIVCILTIALWAKATAMIVNLVLIYSHLHILIYHIVVILLEHATF